MSYGRDAAWCYDLLWEILKRFRFKDGTPTISREMQKVNIDLNQVNNAPFPKACPEVEYNCNKETEATGKRSEKS